MDKKSTNVEGRSSNKDHPSSDNVANNGSVHYSLLQGLPIPTFVIDHDHRVMFWNRALEELSGIKAEDVMGTRQQWRAFYASKRPCMADLLVAEAFEGIERWYAGKYSKSRLIDEAFEATDFFPDLGENGRWLHFTAAAIRDNDGTLVGAVETLEDITIRKDAEEALVESEQKLQSVIQGFPIPAFLIGRNHVVTHWNQALEELSGIPSRDVIGTNHHWRPFYKKERPCLADFLLDQSLEAIHVWYADKASPSNLIDGAYEVTDFFPDLGVAGRWLHFTAAAVKNSQGELVGAIETLEDITDRKTAEQNLQKAHDELEIRVQKRTKDLLESSRVLKAEVIERRQAQQNLKKREQELKVKSDNLEEVNTALRVLLKQREDDKRELEEKILANTKEPLLPYLEKLKKTRLDEHQLANLSEIETNLNDIISPFIRSLTTKYLNLTPREVQVAALVKGGKTTKEIAEFLNTSTAAVDFHRYNIRIKLGLINKKVNLRTHLISYL
jgi:PAS domain-containing protein/DNA-binding CsgD family transcriptional regulator